MVLSLAMGAGIAVVGAYNWAASLYTYNRDAWMTDIQVEQEHKYQEDNLRIAKDGMDREEVRDRMQADINKINSTILVTALILALAGEMLFEGQIPTSCPAFVLNAYMICLGSATLHLVLSILFGTFASHEAYSVATKLLTQTFRPRWTKHFQELKRRKRQELTEAFEDKPLGEILRVPLAGRMQKMAARRSEEPQQEPAASSGRGSEAAEPMASSALHRRISGEAGRVHAVVDVEFNKLAVKWQPLTECMFICGAFGTKNLLEACGYWCLGTLYGQYRGAWAFWAVQIIFTCLIIFMVNFLVTKLKVTLKDLQSQKGKEKFPEQQFWSTWAVRVPFKLPSEVVAIGSSLGPVFCAVAAWTAIPLLDKFCIPFCYLFHFLVSVVSLYLLRLYFSWQDQALEDEVEGPPEGSESICEVQQQAQGQAADSGGDGKLGDGKHRRELPRTTLKYSMRLLCTLWFAAASWALYQVFRGMDFKNKEAAFPWPSAPRVSGTGQEPLTSPSPFFRPHFVVCPRGHLFLANKFTVFERVRTGEVEPYRVCDVNDTILDLAAFCDDHDQRCWPVVLLSGPPPKVFDCRFSTSWPLLQTHGEVTSFALPGDGQRKKLIATVDDDILEYKFDEVRGGYVPRWEIATLVPGGRERTLVAIDVAEMDRGEGRLVKFHRNGTIESQDLASGSECGAWRVEPQEENSLGGGCVYENGWTVLALAVGQGAPGGTLTKATLPETPCGQPEPSAMHGCGGEHGRLRGCATEREVSPKVGDWRLMQ